MYPLIWAQLELTYDCTLRCIHCSVEGGTPLQDELDLNDLEKLVGELRSLRVFWVELTGGEPFCRPDFFDICVLLQEAGIKFSIASNGTLVDEIKVSKLIELSPMNIEISLDGPSSEMHDCVRGKGAFEKAVEAIKLLLATSLSVEVVTTFNKPNMGQIDEIIDFVMSLGVKRFVPLFIMPMGRAANRPDLLITPTEISRIQHRLLEIHRGRSSSLKIRGIYDHSESRNVSSCGVGTKRCLIKPNGDVSPCPMLREIVVGNVREGSFIDMWNNSKILSDLRGLNTSEMAKCSICKYKRACGGGCRGSAVLYGKKGILDADPVRCEWYRVFNSKGG